jgi:hypothetical protein
VVRLFPLVPTGHSGVYPQLSQLRANLADVGVHSRVVDVDYEFQASGNQMLVCHRTSSPQ